MYLAKKRIKKQIHYVIRESIADGDTFKSRDLVELGPDPENWIVYPDNGHAFYFDEALCDALEAKGAEPDNEELEQVFWPFIDPESRRVIEGFSRPPAGRQTLRKEQKQRCQTEAFHMFDKRRMHYLRFGEMDQSRIHRAPTTLYRKLLDKSRDEIEQQFMAMEQVLQAHEKKSYAFVIFDVAGNFSSEIARRFPQALPQEKVDDGFLAAVCRLNADPSFWADMEAGDTLHEYLVRYVCWFFDVDFDGGRYLEDLIWQFKRRHHGFRPPPPRETMPMEAALKMMDIDKSAFAAMTVKTLTRQYRRMAKQYHPDQGGEHGLFIKLNRAFEDLLRKLKGKKGATRYHTRRG